MSINIQLSEYLIECRLIVVLKIKSSGNMSTVHSAKEHIHMKLEN